MSDIRPAARGAEDDPAGCTANDDPSTAGAPPRATTGVSACDGVETPSCDIAPAVAVAPAVAPAPAAVLTAAAGATIAYTAATARSAATALVRMLLREGVFAAAGGESRNDGSDGGSGDSSDGGSDGGLDGAPGSSGAGASGEPGAGEPGAGEPDGWDRMRAVVALTEARRAEVPGLRLVGEAVTRTAARRHPVRAVPVAPAAPLK
ncbi:hypothetical protein [Streptomyces jumonjinensis]|uniref:Uncharacterized protein n=1 Tax=Streptomyces jumonjinensis TaxID=1945 RepID=A0A646KQW0_STRJU|nr:hypothetical protein [Streptomyces jumonjinensis]MQT04719.1 hypothetical protein [Streptomyces jumonjinensis]